MKTEATEGSAGDQFSSTKTYLSALYQKMLDGRKRPIRGLWRHGDSFVARLTVGGCLWPQENGANTIGGRGNCSAGAEGSRQAPIAINNNIGTYWR